MTNETDGFHALIAIDAVSREAFREALEEVKSKLTRCPMTLTFKNDQDGFGYHIEVRNVPQEELSLCQPERKET
jgi:hypothetical protein